MDVDRALRNAAQTGDVELGTKESLEAARDGDADLLVVASNTPATMREQVEEVSEDLDVPVYEYRGLNAELGSACGEPYAVAVLAVLDPGESAVLQLAQGSPPT